MTGAPKHNYTQERSTIIIPSEGVKKKRMKKKYLTTKQSEQPRELMSGGKHIYLAQFATMPSKMMIIKILISLGAKF